MRTKNSLSHVISRTFTDTVTSIGFPGDFVKFQLYMPLSQAQPPPTHPQYIRSGSLLQLHFKGRPLQEVKVPLYYFLICE